MNQRFVVTGGPGGGKSTLLDALAERGRSEERRVGKECRSRWLDALYMLDLESALSRDEIARHVQAFHYNGTVFLLPPWEAIYGMDSERDQTFEESVTVFEGMKRWYARWGYETVEVPRASVEARVSFILEAIGRQSA